ncbi:transposase, partial [Chitinimonas sp. PSY-7]|uniref:transposase n=1 Tax=Chitinimonas sp. PSY-7 TaxID=3459088 RepID=UPI00403FD89A
MRTPYPSDISREQFEAIRPLLENARKKTSPRRVDLYDVFCAVLYLLKSGCQWRMLPSEVGAARVKQGRNDSPTLLIVDAQSVKNTDTAGQKGYDAGKKVS